VTLYVDADPGVCTIDDACARAVDSAKRTGFAVRFQFNGVLVVAYSGSSPAEMAAKYRKQIDARRCPDCAWLVDQSGHAPRCARIK